MAAEEEEFAEIPTGEELFSGEEVEAPQEEPKTEETVQETEEVTKARARDEKGKFVKAEEETPEPEQIEEPEPEPEPEVQPEEKQDHRVPLMELLNEREKRQEEQRRREALEQRMLDYQRQLEALQKPEEPIDIFANPEAYQQTVEQRMAAMQKQMEGNFSLRLARATHKELFDEAWSEMAQRSQMGDDAMRQQVLNSSDPGETLVTLYRQAKTFKEVNGDPNAWLEAKKAEWLNDPAVQAQILQGARQTASTSPQAKPNVKLPPSFNKATSSGNQHGRADASDAALWEDTL